ncbi:hypothetical protein V8E54_009499 [Elaphomyces granulatus]
MDEYEPLNQKDNEDQPEKYGNQLKMADPFYDSITARCFHIWITITAKDRHPWITAEVCHPRIMASCFRKLNLTTVCNCNRTTAEVCHPRIMASCFRKLNLTPVCKLQSDYGRGLSPSDYGLLHSQVESDNLLQIAIGLRPRLVTLGLWLLVFRKLNLTTVCKLQSDYGRGLSPSDYGLLLSQLESGNRLHLQSDHGRGLSPSDYCLLHLQLESDNRLHFAIG